MTDTETIYRMAAARVEEMSDLTRRAREVLGRVGFDRAFFCAVLERQVSHGYVVTPLCREVARLIAESKS